VLNPALSPAVESIVRKCLDPDPARRYQSARDLREDLERQLADRPLRHAPEPSLRERAGKWVRRHPRLSSSTTVAAVAVVVLLACAAGGAAAWRKHQADLAAARAEQSRTAALESWGKLRQVREVQQALANYPDRASVRQVIDLSRESLRAYSLPENPDWETAPELAYLANEERDGLRRTLAAVLAGWSDAEREWAETEPDAGARRERLEAARSLNERAESVLGGQAGQALLRQRARLAELLGRPEAAGLARRASDTPPRSADDHFQLARELLRKREVKQAAPHLAEATRLDPRHFWAWFFLGNCRRELTQTDEAVACYSACAAVAPDGSLAYFPYLNRGTAYASQGKHAEAEADLARAVRALEALPESLGRRERAKPYVALARLRTRDRDYAAAEDLLTRALAAGAADPRLLFERAKVRRLRGDADGARQDLEAGLRSRPENEADWNDRGLARLDAQPRGLFRAIAAQANALAALRDFDEALRLNPVYHTALQNKAAVLSERLGREREALDVLDNLIAMYPGYVPARIGRAVVLARHGKRAEALADVRESLARDRSPVTLYQSANVFALTSRTTPADADRVVPLLGAALWGGFGLDVVDRDSDMDPVRGRADFRRVVDVVRELSGDQRRP
jgi:tetratricopeptide (TPR) repeat protein